MDDDVSIAVRLKEVARFQADSRRAANSIDNIGDQARQAARGMRELNAASSSTRLSFGPFSTNLRGGALAVGLFANSLRTAGPLVLSTAEAVGTLAGGAGAGAGVGLLALAQGAAVAKLGMGDLASALGGNQTALKRLTPEVRDLFQTLNDNKKTLKASAQEGLLPGLTSGSHKALRNFHVVNRIVKDTGRTLGGLANDAGGMLGSAAWGRDIGTLGKANTRILDDLGHAGLNLADALRNVAVEAAPLAEWMAKEVRDGARFIEVWTASARASGDMAKFFRSARTDMTLLGSSLGHGGRGLINLFGAHDVNGTKTLESLDKIMGRFERWTSSPALAHGLGNALVAEMPKVAGKAVGMLAQSLAHAAPTGARIFVDAFMQADAWGKLLVGGWLASKLGGFKLLGKVLGRGGGGGAFGAVTGRGSTPANPLFVVNVAGGGLPGAGRPGRGGARSLPGLLSFASKVALPAYLGNEAKNFLDDHVNLPGGDLLYGGVLNNHAFRQRAAAAVRGVNTGPQIRPSQGYLNPGSDPMRRVPDQVVVMPQTINIDGQPVATVLSTATIRRRARMANP